jgi:PAS domain S-box-containing protein
MTRVAHLEDERFLSSIVEQVPDAMFVKDATTLEYVLFNRALESVLGRTRAEIAGRTDADLFPPAQAQALAERDRAALRASGLVDVGEESFRTHEHGWRTFHTKRVAIADDHGVPRYLLGIARDITEQRLAEVALREARAVAERASRAKSDFLARVSHELRTPLNAVLGFAQLFQPERLSPADRENVQQILAGGRHLLELIDQVLDISRIEAGHLLLTREAVDVYGVAREATEMIRPLAAARDVTVRLASRSPQATALVDRHHLRQVLLNLCSNGVKYNRPGGSVTVSWQASGASVVRLAVHDEGIGIAAEKLPRLFTPFERLGAEQTTVEGTGLGLALCKRLVEAMGGALSVESQPGRGSTFFVDLPAAPVAGAATTPPPAPEPSPARAVSGLVLYVEDTPANARLMQRLMSRRPGVNLLVAPDGRTGLALFARHRPPLVVLDLHLPDMSGEDVLREIRQSHDGPQPRIAVLTADASSTQRERLLALGADAYLTKPLNIADMLALLDGTLATGDAR